MNTLITIPFSHFCEKARWSLDVAGVPYREEGHTPALHRPAVRRAGGRGTVPVLMTGDGRVLDDSPLIVQYADEHAPEGSKLLPPPGPGRDEVLALERHLDRELAPHVRRLVYFHILPRRALALDLFRQEVPRREQFIVTVAFPVLRRFMQRFMKIDDTTALDSRDRVRRVFGEIGERLADGRRFLCGDQFGLADITFAAFAAPLVLPAEHPRFHVNPDALPPLLADEARALEASPAGQFARSLYRERRRKALTLPPALNARIGAAATGHAGHKTAPQSR